MTLLSSELKNLGLARCTVCQHASLFLATLRQLSRGRENNVQRRCYNQLQKYLRHCTVFWLKWLVHDLVLVTPPPPLFKVASNTRPCSKLGGTTLNGERGEVGILSHRSVTSSDLKQDRLFCRESVSTFLQLVVAITRSIIYRTMYTYLVVSSVFILALLFLTHHSGLIRILSFYFG